MRVLVVDDDEAYLQLLHMVLKRRGHDVIEAKDGKAAWELMQENPFPMVVSDWMMPEMDGIELTLNIRKIKFKIYTYIILLTAKKTTEEVIEGLEAGADDYLTKPFDLNELRARIKIGERIIALETELRESRDKLIIQATRDSLTELLNRRGLYECIELETARAKREDIPLSLLMIDLDHFKSVNDNYGHLVGDEALCLVADIISEKKRIYDAAGRWGGEEFIIVLPGANMEEAQGVAERMRSAISNARLDTPEGKPVTIHGSFGVVSVDPKADISLDTLVGMADQALYRAKQGGGDRVSVYQEDQAGNSVVVPLKTDQ
jgi:two-component system chemotaxis response regulator CheY